MSIKVGITGQTGFIGSHLFNYLKLQEDIDLVNHNVDFQNDHQLKEFVQSCEVIVHLAGVNRHDDPQEIFDGNLMLTHKLIGACKSTLSKPHIIFSSSTQEGNDTAYGRAKQKCRLLFEEWASEIKGRFTGLIVPNVFGPFGRPFYNSVVATFCYQVANDEKPEIKSDAQLNLLYINELVSLIAQFIKDSGRKDHLVKYSVPHTKTISVSEILNILLSYKDQYLSKGNIPSLEDSFNLNLFNTFRCYIPARHYPVHLTQHKDPRGSFVEIIRSGSAGQFSFSTTKPGITRGNHYHTRKAERFAVIQGKAKIQLRKTGTSEITNYYLDGENPSFVDMPVWHVHNITNIGDTDLYTLFWINEPYDARDPDTYLETV